MNTKKDLISKTLLIALIIHRKTFNHNIDFKKSCTHKTEGIYSEGNYSRVQPLKIMQILILFFRNHTFPKRFTPLSRQHS